MPIGIIILQGEWETAIVHLDGKRLYPGKSQRVWNHSPDGFNWGFEGSGPAQLALAILLEHLLQEEAVRYHQAFKREIIAALPREDFLVSVNLRQWIERHKKEVRLETRGLSDKLPGSGNRQEEVIRNGRRQTEDRHRRILQQGKETHVGSDTPARDVPELQGLRFTTDPPKKGLNNESKMPGLQQGFLDEPV